MFSSAQYFRERFKHAPEQWHKVMRATIALNGSFFNTHRMLGQYAENAYFRPVKATVDQLQAGSEIYVAHKDRS